MSSYSYIDFFQQFPSAYRNFETIVDHSDNFYQELHRSGILRGVSSVLSIGAGEGELELRLAKEDKIKLAYVEPATQFVKRYKSRRAEIGVEEFCYEIWDGPFQNYSTESKFDLVILIHSWYAFGFDRKIFEKCSALLKPSGRIFITIISENSLTWKIGNLANNQSGQNLSAEKLSDWFKSESLDHDYRVNIRKVPAKKMLCGEELTPIGKNFVSFISFCPWNQMDVNLQDRIKRLFIEETKGENINLRCGCLIF